MTDEPTQEQLDKLSQRFLRFADEVFAGYCPLYDRISRGIATDRDLLTIAAATRPGQPVPNILFSAVKFLMLGGTAPQHPIHAMYAAASPDADAQPDDAFEIFRDFALAHRDALHLQVAYRNVQTNEVNRCAVIMPGACEVAARAGGEPLNWLEIGTSAGLNLRWPNYRYEYTSTSAQHEFGPEESAVVVHCELRGDRQPPFTQPFPTVRASAGIDLQRVDLADPDSARWLESLVWPGHPVREARLHAAIEAAVADPPTVVEGHALTWLRQLDQFLPADGPLVVVHSFVLNQFPSTEREAFHQQLADLSQTRDVYRIGYESTRDMTAEVRLSTWHGGSEASDDLLAMAQAHGRWLDWRHAGRLSDTVRG